MTRKEAYAKIKNLNLQDLIKEITGKNYTNVSTSELISIVNDYNSKSSTRIDDNIPTDIISTTNTTISKKAVTVMVDGSTTIRLIEILRKKNILLESEQDYILGLP